MNSNNMKVLFSLLAALVLPHVNALSTTVTRQQPPSLFQSHFPQKKNSFPSNKSKGGLSLTYLEINGYLLTMGGITILIDPILEGPLDFGIPDIYTASKRTLPPAGLCEALPPIDSILITQGLDDHAHVRTLTKLAKLDPQVPIIAPPSARGALQESGFLSSQKGNIRFLRHGQDAVITSRFVDDRSRNSNSNDAFLSVKATIGALVGPPWQTRENGYVIKSSKGIATPSVYIEPHVEYNEKQLQTIAPIDVVITPITGQGLTKAFELVHGPKETVKLLNILQPKVVVAMKNGDVNMSGALSPLIQEIGSVNEFRKQLKQKQPSINSSSTSVKNKNEIRLLELTPGEDVQINL